MTPRDRLNPTLHRALAAIDAAVAEAEAYGYGRLALALAWQERTPAGHGRTLIGAVLAALRQDRAAFCDAEEMLHAAETLEAAATATAEQLRMGADAAVMVRAAE